MFRIERQGAGDDQDTEAVQRGVQGEGGAGGVQGEQTIAELASKHGLHPNLITNWKRQAVDGLPGLFEGKAAEADKGREAELRELHAKIGQLVVERDFLAKTFGRRATIGG